MRHFSLSVTDVIGPLGFLFRPHVSVFLPLSKQRREQATWDECKHTDLHRCRGLELGGEGVSNRAANLSVPKMAGSEGFGAQLAVAGNRVIGIVAENMWQAVGDWVFD